MVDVRRVGMVAAGDGGEVERVGVGVGDALEDFTDTEVEEGGGERGRYLGGQLVVWK